MSDNKNYILEVRVEHRDGRAKYARSGYWGYTNNLEDAGRFTKKEAEDYVIGQESKYEAKPFTSPPTVTISRESAKIARSKIQETLGQSERFYALMPDSKMTRGEFNRIMEKEIAAVDELTKAMEASNEQ